MEETRRTSAMMATEELQTALQNESRQFEQALCWLEQHMPPSFLEEVGPSERMLIARNLLSFPLQDAFSQIHLRQMALVLCLDGPDADLRILQPYGLFTIRYYRTFVSNEAPPFGHFSFCLRIALIVFSDGSPEIKETPDPVQIDEIFQLIHTRNSALSREEVATLINGLSPRFLRSMTKQRLSVALDLFFHAKTEDLCQYEVRYNQEWVGENNPCASAIEKFIPAPGKEAPSLQLLIAWRNVPKYRFLYRLAEMIYHHGLALQKVVATYIEPYGTDSTLILSLGLHGLKGGAAWAETDLDDFLRELALLKFEDTDDAIDETFVKKGLLSGNEAHLVRTFIALAHQALVYADPHLYSYENVTDGLCRHPELTIHLCQSFAAKFHPVKHNLTIYQDLHQKFMDLLDHLDTGQPSVDMRRKNILKTVLSIIHDSLKTNFYCPNKSAIAFRLDPTFWDHLPFERSEKFPILPFGIFFIRGVHFIGFHTRFKDLARGGVRTVMPETEEQFTLERNSIFSEGYHLALTQQKKNKDIPEGGAKTIILLDAFSVFSNEETIYAQEMERAGFDQHLIETKLKEYKKAQKLSFLYASQRSFIENFMTLINCDEAGHLRDSSVIDYWKRPEYIYLGPDENMHNVMIDWIADFSAAKQYRPGRSFMSSKSEDGINHKEFGVTSFGVNVYLEETLRFLGIDPKKDIFTVKISGGPDGDVAGNEIYNLSQLYPNTARLVALTDVSGTISDPMGLDWAEMASLFKRSLPIRHYPPAKLHDGGFLLDLEMKQDQSALSQQTLCWEKKDAQLTQHWLSGNEMHSLYCNNIHQIPCDCLITAGGRPRALNESNYSLYLDETGRPKTRAIVEGANLYLTPGARAALEKKGVLIMKDSSCNKGGVICSSFEVLAGLCLTKEEFIKEKDEYIGEVRQIIGKMALDEARLILSTHVATKESMSAISDQISEKINLFKYQLLETMDLPKDPDHFLNRCLIQYAPPLLRTRYRDRLLAIPEIHKKAIIASFIAAHLVYSRGIRWSPALTDILPILSQDPNLLRESNAL